MTDRTPALEWAEVCQGIWKARCGYFVAMVWDLSSEFLWAIRWEAKRGIVTTDASLWAPEDVEPTLLAAQLAAEDFLRAQRDALGVLGGKEES